MRCTKWCHRLVTSSVLKQLINGFHGFTMLIVVIMLTTASSEREGLQQSHGGEHRQRVHKADGRALKDVEGFWCCCSPAEGFSEKEGRISSFGSPQCIEDAICSCRTFAQTKIWDTLSCLSVAVCNTMNLFCWQMLMPIECCVYWQALMCVLMC